MSGPLDRPVGLSDKKRALRELLLRERDQARVPWRGKIPRRPVGSSVPLSFAQGQLWFLDQWHPLSSAYNVPVAYRLTGPFDVAAAEMALTEIVRRHETLRTTFSEVGGVAVPTVHGPESVRFHRLDLSNLAPDMRAAELQLVIDAEARRSFDLTRDAMLRPRVIDLGPDDRVLQFTAHHIACDGRSLGILLRELAHLYDAFVSGTPTALPDVPLQYGDYACWQRENATT
jgi:hypothetical protein